MNLIIIMLVMILVSVIMVLFFLSSKMEKWENLMSSSFECGFSSYFYSRFSFSIHYFMVGLIFLFLDLELCFMMPMLNETMMSINMMIYMLTFITILLGGLIKEWKEGELNWKF